MQDYLQKTNFRKLTTQEKAALDESIAQEEILTAIEHMKLGKAPGTDGFTAKFYKTFKNDLVQWIQLVTNNVLKGEDPPKTWQDATISMIPKEEHECLNVKNFRSISLLKVDYKILVNVLEERLKNFLNDYIGEDQAGLLKTI